jgi:hypothetical protein
VGGRWKDGGRTVGNGDGKTLEVDEVRRRRLELDRKERLYGYLSLSLYLSACLSICLSVPLTECPSVCLSFFCLSVFHFVCLCVPLTVSRNQPVSQSVRHLVSQPVTLYVCVVDSMSACLSTCIFLMQMDRQIDREQSDHINFINSSPDTEIIA